MLEIAEVQHSSHYSYVTFSNWLLYITQRRSLSLNFVSLCLAEKARYASDTTKIWATKFKKG